MSSDINTSIPPSGHAETAQVRAQFATIKREIESLQRGLASVVSAIQGLATLPENAVDRDELARVALSGSYFHLTHRPSIPSSAADLGALPTSGGAMTGPLELGEEATTAMGAVPLQQLNKQLAVFAPVARSGSYHDLTGRPTLGSAAATSVTDYATAAQGAKADTALQRADLAQVATSGQYADLAGRPALGSAAATSVSDYATAAQGAKADTAVQPDSLAAVATSGQYADLVGKPMLGTAAATDASAYATAAQGAKADTAVQPGDLAAVATTGDFSSLSGRISESQLDGDLAAKLNNSLPYKVDATRPPGPQDDVSQGWVVGALWIDVQAQEAYRCVSNEQGNAVWANTTLTTAELANVALSGNYADLVGKPMLGTAAATDASAYATAAQGAKADTAVQPGSLAAVATSGQYADLVGKPTLGTAAATDASAYATAAQGAKADTAVQPGSLAAVATSGQYADLAGKPAALSEFANDRGFITAADIPANPVISVNGKQGAVNLTAADVGAAHSVHTHSAATTSSPGFLSASDKQKIDNLAAVATSGQYADLAGRPTLGSAAATNANAYATAAQGVLAVTAVQPEDLAAVATSGKYSDLSGVPIHLVLPPVGLVPSAGAVIADPTAPLELIASAFATVITDAHVATQWQVSTDPNFSTIEYDSGEVTA